MHNKLIAAAAFVLASFAAHAGPIIDVIFVRYEGRVSAVHPASGDAQCLCGYDVGKPVAGTLLVDLASLASDLAPDRDDFADYFVEPPFLGPSFVVGSGPVRAVSRDRVQIADRLDGVDLFLIQNSESGVAPYASGRERYELDSLLLRVSSLAIDFVHGEGIAQEFTLAGARVGAGEIQIRREWLDEPANPIGGMIELVLTKLSVKPGRCSF